MDTYIVKITDEALEDMQAIFDHIAHVLQAPLTAKRQLHRLMDEILSLELFPERYSIVDAEPWQSRKLRHMPVDNYTVFYTIRGNSVIVTDILYSASDLIARLRQ